jgi:ParB family transcriptional regulator, chromosome partitioning protein
MRHDSHYVEELLNTGRSVGKVISIDHITPNPEQPRTEFGDLTDLTASIREKGVLEPLLVKPTGNGEWMIIAGERRWRAANLAGLTEVPCIEMDLDEQSIAEIALIENLQRKDLTIWEEADGLAALAQKFGYTQEEIAKKISKSRTTVTELMTVASIPPEIREMCLERKINAKTSLLEVARQFDEKEMVGFLEKISPGQAPSREKVRKLARPDKATLSAIKTAPIAKASAHTFSYESSSGDFEIEVRFNNANLHSRRGVLKALKEAFDEVKNENVDV